MELYPEIRDTLTQMISNYRLNESSIELSESSTAELVHKLLTKIEGKDKCIERLYLFYYLSEIVRHMSDSESQEFINTLFCWPLNQRQCNLMSQLISLALSLHNEELLNCTAKYVLTCDHLSLSNDIKLDTSLATDSPKFCAALISKGYFVGNGITKRQLTQWLNTLVNLIDDNQLVLNACIRFSLLEGPIDSNLHLAILCIIKERKCQPLSNQLVIDLATVIAQRPNNDQVVDHLAQMIIIAYASNMCHKSNHVKNTLVTKFPNNLLIKAICK